jgi:hypothetical protein
MRAVSSLTFQVRRSGIKLKSDVWLMALSAEMIHDPQQQAQHHAQQNARHHRKIKTSIPSLICNIARQTPQPKWQLPSEREQRPHAYQHDSHHKKELPGLA